MNREAVALGVPVYTTFAGRLGGVDEALIREGRLGRSPTRARSSCASETAGSGPRVRRDPQLMLGCCSGRLGVRTDRSNNFDREDERR